MGGVDEWLVWKILHTNVFIWDDVVYRLQGPCCKLKAIMSGGRWGWEQLQRACGVALISGGYGETDDREILAE